MHVVDTAKAHDEHDLSLGLDVEAALGAGLALGGEPSQPPAFSKRGVRGRDGQRRLDRGIFGAGGSLARARGERRRARRRRASPSSHSRVKNTHHHLARGQTLGWEKAAKRPRRRRDPRAHLITVLLHVLLRAVEDLLLVGLGLSLGLRGGLGLVGGPRLVALTTLKSGLGNSGLLWRKRWREESAKGRVWGMMRMLNVVGTSETTREHRTTSSPRESGRSVAVAHPQRRSAAREPQPGRIFLKQRESREERSPRNASSTWVRPAATKSAATRRWAGTRRSPYCPP